MIYAGAQRRRRRARHYRPRRRGGGRHRRPPRAGFKPGDLIVAIDGNPIESFDDLQRIVGVNAGQELTFTVDRGGETLTLEGDAERATNSADAFGGTFRRGLIGIQRSTVARLRSARKPSARSRPLGSA